MRGIVWPAKITIVVLVERSERRLKSFRDSFGEVCHGNFDPTDQKMQRKETKRQGTETSSRHEEQKNNHEDTAVSVVLMSSVIGQQASQAAESSC